MSIEAHKCNASGCKGFIVFENADFNISNPPTVNGMYEFHNPVCTECGKEYKVVPHYVVISFDEQGDLEEVEPACITEWERREKVRNLENETDPHEKIRKYIQLHRYTYSVADILSGYLQHKQGAYVSYTMKDCIEQLRPELERLIN
ncbi:hypothetical protein P4U90_20850 [Cytobacillus kochii]|uniref:hypothetical protein n=1 Tax=Cytobacillus kochii TaxID=859143 RepID=UPI002E22AB2E|nr:hypothetical protein [Cytobacillus kochii]